MRDTSVHFTMQTCNMNAAQLAKFRTQICQRRSTQGLCFLQEKCPFSHCLSWHRRNPMHTAYRPALCPNVLFTVGADKKMKVKNHCQRGRLCLYSHTKEEQMYHPLIYKSQLCRDWPYCHKQFCPFGKYVLFLFHFLCFFFNCFLLAHGTEELRSSEFVNFAVAQGPEKLEVATLLHQALEKQNNKQVPKSFRKLSNNITYPLPFQLTLNNELKTNASNDHDNVLESQKIILPSSQILTKHPSRPVPDFFQLHSTYSSSYKNTKKLSPFPIQTNTLTNDFIMGSTFPINHITQEEETFVSFDTNEKMKEKSCMESFTYPNTSSLQLYPSLADDYNESLFNIYSSNSFETQNILPYAKPKRERLTSAFMLFFQGWLDHSLASDFSFKQGNDKCSTNQIENFYNISDISHVLNDILEMDTKSVDLDYSQFSTPISLLSSSNQPSCEL
jgi:hypothetical protein